MANKEILTKEYMQLKDVFADVFNFFLFDGKEVIQPQQLREKNTDIFDIRRLPSAKKQPVQQFRDLLCLLSMTDDTHSYLLLGIENQTQVQYALPIRGMLYDALQYRDQIKLITKQRRLERQQAAAQENHVTPAEQPWSDVPNVSANTSAEFLSGFQKEDRLHPVITVVIYFCTDPWYGPRSVHDMLSEISPELLEFIPNYKLHLIEPAALSCEQLQKFQSNLREILLCIKYANDKERLDTIIQDPRFGAVQYEAAAILNEFADLKLDLTDNHKGGTINMLPGFEQLREDYKRQGQALGSFETQLTCVKSLMANLNLDIEAAMKALDISEEQQALILKQLTPSN